MAAKKVAPKKRVATKKLAPKKKVAPRKAGAPKKTAPRKAAPKKAAPKKAAPKKTAPKKAAPKKAAPKKAAPKNAAPKNAAPKNAAPKNAASKNAAPKNAAPPPEAKKTPAPAAESAETPAAASFNFTEEIAAFCELVNSGGAGEADLEGYASFNEQYKPSDWARNPALDQQMLTFAMDGAGGQFTLWRQHGRELIDNPVVQLGDDGELRVLASDFPLFVALVASGMDLFSREVDNLTQRPQMQEFLKERFGERTFGDAGSILSTAQTAWSNFDAWMKSQVRAD